MSSRGSSSPSRASPRRRTRATSSPGGATTPGSASTPAAGSSSPIHYGSSSPTRSVPATPGEAPGSNHSIRSSPERSPRRAVLAGAGVQRQVDLGGSGAPSEPSSHHSNPPSQSEPWSADLTSEAGAARESFLWGTNVHVHQAGESFKQFFTEFIDPSTSVRKYMVMLSQRRKDGLTHIDLNCKDLKDYDDRLHKQLMQYPTEIIPIFDVVLSDIFKAEFRVDPDVPLQIRTHSLDQVSSMRELDPKDLLQLVSIEGMVIRSTPIIPDCNQGFFQCSVCQNTVEVRVDHGVINEPNSCDNCNTVHSMELIHNRCNFSDKQMVRIQEAPENVPDGQTPQTVSAYVYDDLVDVVQPGDKVVVTGIYQADRLRLNPRLRKIKSVFRTHIDVVHFSKTATDRVLKDNESNEEIDEATRLIEEEELRELSRDPNIQQKLVDALAPNIFEFDDVKRGVLAQLFGGTHKEFNEEGRGRFRGEINVLLCGDPGTSKSQLLQYAVKLAPRGLYTSGKGSSAVGLTAYVTKDPETKQIVLESGALVLCDGGICCIDEFDKMADTTRVILHEAMEQQTISVAKAGIIATLNARTSILAAANPQESRWNPKLSIVDNIQLPPTLLSRFDLIYLILDTPDREKDDRLARHIVSLYYKDATKPREDRISRETLAKYISFARREIQPKITEEAGEHLISCYTEMRRQGNTRKTVTATPRQLESLIRLSEAHARMRFSVLVEKIDVEEAVHLVRTALKQSATDPRTGMIDISLITTGQSTFGQLQAKNLAEQLRKTLLKPRAKTYEKSYADLLEESKEKWADVELKEEDLRAALDRLAGDDAVQLRAGDVIAVLPFDTDM